MKKYFIAAFLVGSVLSLSSCDNGNYDVNPNGSPKARNPLDPSSGVTIFLGNVKTEINGTEWFFTPAGYKFLDGTYTITGKIPNDSIFKREIKLVIKNLSDENAEMQYTMFDTLRFDTIAIYTQKENSVKLKLNGSEDGNLRGTFSGTLYRSFPTGDSGDDKLQFTDGEFYVSRKE